MSRNVFPAAGRCRECGEAYHQLVEGAPFEGAPPKPRDVILCGECGAMAVLDDELRPVAPWDGWDEGVSDQQLVEIGRAQMVIRELRKSLKPRCRTCGSPDHTAARCPA